MAQPFDPLDTTGNGLPARQPADWSTYADQGFRYTRWDGSQRLPDIHADDVLDELSDDLMEDGDIEDALMRLMRPPRATPRHPACRPPRACRASRASSGRSRGTAPTRRS